MHIFSDIESEDIEIERAIIRSELAAERVVPDSVCPVYKLETNGDIPGLITIICLFWTAMIITNPEYVSHIAIPI